jgi:hypothetical protein
MAKPGFFNDNRNRTFPFQQGTAGVATPSSGSVTMRQLPDEFIVDCGFVMGPESGFLASEHTVFLHSISRASLNVILFEFRSDAPELQGSPLVFSRNIAEADYTTEFVESDIPEYIPLSQSVSLSLSESESVICGEPFWSGYLVTGSLTAITERLNIGETILRADSTEALVEPALIQNLNQSQVVSINIANGDRTRAIRPADCPPNEWAFETGLVYTNRECLQGDIKLRAGYNLSLSQFLASNTIQFAATVNAGLGEPCEEVPLFLAETPPLGAGNNLLAGDFYCNEALRTINGLQGPNINLIAESGVVITADQEANTVVIDVNLVDLAVCTFSAVSESI